jgi:hypothetical protein
VFSSSQSLQALPSLLHSGAAHDLSQSNHKQLKKDKWKQSKRDGRAIVLPSAFFIFYSILYNIVQKFEQVS